MLLKEHLYGEHCMAEGGACLQRGAHYRGLYSEVIGLGFK